MLTHPRHLRSIERWVWSAVYTCPEGRERPVVEEYSLFFEAPFHFRCGYAGCWALCHCEMIHDQYEAADQHPGIFLLDDLHSHEPIPESMAIALGPGFGISLTDSVRDALVKLSDHHVHFLPKR
jgi:hypothetical protein